jgi:hypothetical protein
MPEVLKERNRGEAKQASKKEEKSSGQQGKTKERIPQAPGELSEVNEYIDNCPS